MTLYMLGNAASLFVNKTFFSKKSFRDANRVSNGLDPDQTTLVGYELINTDDCTESKTQTFNLEK